MNKENENDEVILKPMVNLGELLIPFITISMFIILTIFVFVPQITNALDLKEQIEVLKKEESKIEANIVISEKLNEDSNLVSQDLNIAKSIIASKLAVSDFSFDINDLAIEKGLSLQSISSSDIAYTDSDDLLYATGTIKGVTGPMRYEGSFEDIVSFLEHIKLESTYLIETSETRLRSFTDTDRWSLELAITGYYMVDNENLELNPLLPIKLYTDLEVELADLHVRSNSNKE